MKNNYQKGFSWLPILVIAAMVLVGGAEYFIYHPLPQAHDYFPEPVIAPEKHSSTPTPPEKPVTAVAPPLTSLLAPPDFISKFAGIQTAELKATNFDVTMDYPQLHGIADPKIEAMINASLKAENVKLYDDIVADGVAMIGEDCSPLHYNSNFDSYRSSKFPQYITFRNRNDNYFPCAAHPWSGYLLETWDLSTGKQLHLSDLFVSSTTYPDKITTYLQSASNLEEKNGKDKVCLYDSSYLNAWKEQLEQYDDTEDFLLTDSGVTFLFYAGTPYCAGQVDIITVPYSYLKGMLKPEFTQ